MSIAQHVLFANLFSVLFHMQFTVLHINQFTSFYAKYTKFIHLLCIFEGATA